MPLSARGLLGWLRSRSRRGDVMLLPIQLPIQNPPNCTSKRGETGLFATRTEGLRGGSVSFVISRPWVRAPRVAPTHSASMTFSWLAACQKAKTGISRSRGMISEREILRNEHAVLTVSSLVPACLHLGEVSLSLPAVINRDGVVRVLPISLNPSERKALETSAEVLKGRSPALAGHKGRSPGILNSRGLPARWACLASSRRRWAGASSPFSIGKSASHP